MPEPTAPKTMTFEEFTKADRTPKEWKSFVENKVNELQNTPISFKSKSPDSQPDMVLVSILLSLSFVLFILVKKLFPNIRFLFFDPESQSESSLEITRLRDKLENLEKSILKDASSDSREIIDNKVKDYIESDLDEIIKDKISNSTFIEEKIYEDFKIDLINKLNEKISSISKKEINELYIDKK